jgi:alpha-L-rhamnosidase
MKEALHHIRNRFNPMRIVALAFLIAAMPTQGFTKMLPVNPRCESVENPMGIDQAKPRLSWMLASKDAGALQTAYQIEVVGVWDSGKVTSDRSTAIPYGGSALESGKTYPWRVRVWDGKGVASPWSEPARWTVGKLQPGDWSARWIGAPDNPAPWFRGEFDLTGQPSSATVTVHSHAYFELYLNGVKAGDDVLTPAVADAKAQTFTVTYDVARLLKPGANCLGLWMSKGWANPLAVRAQLDAVVDGRKVTFGTGPDWKTRPSGYRHIGRWNWNDFGGERVDAAAHVPDWAKPGLDTSGWIAAVKAPALQGAPINLIGPMNRIGEQMPAKKITALADGRYEIDFGTNLTGWLHLKFPPLKAGQLVRMHFADHLFPDGVHTSPIGDIAINASSCVSFARSGGGHNHYQTYKQTSDFVSAGFTGEEFQHKFNYAGFRYVVVEGLDTAPRLKDATALLVESALADAGSFECSDPLLNRIHQANKWTMRALNLGAYYVDCPHRERMGYGDGQVAVPGMMMNFDSSLFYAKWARDWRLALEKKHEHLPYIAPPFEKTGGGPPWPGGIARIPWQHYLHYGDPAILEENIDAARSYCEYLDGRSTDDVLRAWGTGFSFIGDWVPPGRGMDTKNWPNQKMAEFFCNAYRVHLWQLVGKMAVALERASDADHARARAEAIGKATHAAFFDAANQRYVIDEQIYYAFPLLVGLTPETNRPGVLENLIRCIVEKNQGHLDSGMLGTMLLLEYLRQIGRDDLILGMYQKKTYPGWGYMIEQGATTLWEQWNGHWSQIHSCFTSADNWLYHGLAGIRPDPLKPGFKNVIIQPAIVGNITWVKAHHDGPYGRIISYWRREGAKVTLDVTIPPNSTATVHLPGREPKQVGSGTHQFQSSF